MVASDFLIGLVLARLLARKGPACPAPAPGPLPPSPEPTPAPGPSPLPPSPKFPENIPPAPSDESDDPAQPAPGFKRAVEVWQVAIGAGEIRALERAFPRNWRAVAKLTPAEIAAAKALLPQWREGGVIFAGPDTLSGRRAFRMTKHPASASPSSPPAPVQPKPAQPSSPGIVPPIVPPTPAPEAPSSAMQVTAVRKGEGLAQVAKRLGRPENATSALELQRVNVPTGPDGVTWQKRPLAEGGIKRAGRAGGLQPGDRLFVPATWGADASRL